MSRRRRTSADSDWNEYKKVDTKRKKKQKLSADRKQKLSRKENFLS
jgi:hypothetical protein